MKSIFLINKSKLHIKKKLYYLVNINKIRFFFVCLFGRDHFFYWNQAITLYHRKKK